MGFNSAFKGLNIPFHRSTDQINAVVHSDNCAECCIHEKPVSRQVSEFGSVLYEKFALLATAMKFTE